MRALVFWAALVAACTLLACSCVSDLMAADAEADALHCARTLDDRTDLNIVRCFTDRGLPAPADLT
jgi:hypothetical protein